MHCSLGTQALGSEESPILSHGTETLCSVNTDGRKEQRKGCHLDAWICPRFCITMATKPSPSCCWPADWGWWPGGEFKRRCQHEGHVCIQVPSLRQCGCCPGCFTWMVGCSLVMPKRRFPPLVFPSFSFTLGLPHPGYVQPLHPQLAAHPETWGSSSSEIIFHVHVMLSAV